MVMAVGAGRLVAQHLALGDFTDEHHMAAKILLLNDLAGEHGVAVLRQVEKAVVAALCFGPGIQLVDLAAGLETKMLDGLKGNILRQHADIEHAGAFDHFPGQIAHLHGDHQMVGAAGHLNTGIGDAAVVLIFPCGNYVHSVRQIAQCRRVDRRFSLLNESSAPASPEEPCHDELRREPFRGQCRGLHPGRCALRT